MKILSFDLGTNSIGWAFITIARTREINGMGVRLIPLSTDEGDEFGKGNAISKNQSRTAKRQARRNLDRYQQRRAKLTAIFKSLGITPSSNLINLPKLELWKLRSDATSQRIELDELARILLLLNQKRGYQHSKKANQGDGNDTDYVAKVKARHSYLMENNLTVGNHIYQELKKDSHYKYKEEVYTREAYKEEFEAIWSEQSKHYPNILTEKLKVEIRDKTLFFQRPLKSQKGLVSVCEFESKIFKDQKGKDVVSGPKVAPKSSPLFQVSKIWQSINSIIIKDKKGVPYAISLEKKQQLFEHLNQKEKLSETELFKILGINKKDYVTNALMKKGIQGNLTLSTLIKAIDVSELELLKFETLLSEDVDKETGEIRSIIDDSIFEESLYKIWHIIHSLSEKDAAKKLKEIGFSDESIDNLVQIDFTASAFGNMSAKAIRKILPFLQKGFVYSDACEKAGYNHSNSKTKEENEARELLEELKLLPKNSLRQPVVEKVLNQLILLVNEIIKSPKYGRPDEIRIELARELKQSKDERNKTFSNNNKREKKHKAIVDELLNYDWFRKKKVSRRDIERYKLWEEFDGISPYEPNKKIGLHEVFDGVSYDIEHIIPKSLKFDDSFSNKTLCPRKMNAGQDGKNQMTAFDYMEYRRSDTFEEYIEFINRAFKENKISRTKLSNLLCTKENIDSSFIERQLRQTQYISKKSKEILELVCKDVVSTTGTITAELRRLWGYNEILERINIPKYKALELTEEVEIRHKGQVTKQIKIKDWSKRDDHRHHAVDALVVACNSQGMIQRLNTLSSKSVHDEMHKVYNKTKNRSQLEQYLQSLRVFSTADVINEVKKITISMKSGQKTATWSRRLATVKGKKKIVQSQIIEPRGALSDETVYGKIQQRKRKMIKFAPSFDLTLVDKIVPKAHQIAVRERLAEFENKPKKAFKGYAKNPILIDGEPLLQVQYDVYEKESIVKRKIEGLTAKQVSNIVDEGIKRLVEARIEREGNLKNALKSFEKKPIYQNEAKGIKVKSVRCYTNSSGLVPITILDKPNNIEYDKFVEPGNNHHIALYEDKTGKLVEHVCTFWHAVERKKYNLPSVIEDPSKAWDKMINTNINDQAFLDNLPKDSWKYKVSFQRNEVFIHNMTQEEIIDCFKSNKISELNNNLYKVRKLTSGAYWFNQQFETEPRESVMDKKSGRCIQCSKSSYNGFKIKVDRLGEIISIDGKTIEDFIN